jgi:hypothetical protein
LERAWYAAAAASRGSLLTGPSPFAARYREMIAAAAAASVVLASTARASTAAGPMLPTLSRRLQQGSGARSSKTAAKRR